MNNNDLQYTGWTIVKIPAWKRWLWDIEKLWNRIRGRRIGF